MIKVQLIGRVGSKPELRSTKSGRNVSNFNVDVSAGKDANGEYVSKWYGVTCWEAKADLAEKIVNKGDLLFIEGNPEISSWTDKSGVEHNELSVNCKYLQVLARSKRAGGEEAPVQATIMQEPDPLSELPF